MKDKDMTELVTDADLRALLLSGDFGGALGKALAQADQAVIDEIPRTTIAERKDELARALAELDDEKLIELQETMSNYVDTLARAEVEFDGYGGQLTQTQKVYLMRRYLDTKAIKELAEVVNDGLKRIVGEAVTAKVHALDPEEPFPEHVSGDIEVPELGYRFCKEGAGRATPLLDQDELRRQLGEDDWAKVTQTITVPAHEVTELSEALLMQLAAADPSVLEKIKASCIPGGWKTWRFYVRKITKAKK